MSKVKFFVLGLDGATFDIVKPMVDDGRLPYFSKIMSDGVWGKLQSTILPITAPAWSSFMTGKNPGKHGVFGFFEAREDSYETNFVTGSSIKTEKVWDYFDKDKKIALIDIPLTYPPVENINGCMISGMPVPSQESIFTYPPELHTELVSEIGNYMIDNELSAKTRASKTLDSLRLLYDYTKMRIDAMHYLINKKGPFDFFMLVLRGTDFVQHAAFKYHDNEYTVKHDHEYKKYGQMICQFYEKIDKYLGEVLEIIGDDGTLFIMSDHGAGPLKRLFYINRWLKKEGYLSLNKNAKFIKTSFETRTKKVSDVFNKFGVPFMNNLIPGFIKTTRLPYILPVKKHPSVFVDWKNTKAFANLTWTDGLIKINLEGRQPDGSVTKEQYDAICDEVINKLKALVDPLTNEKVMDGVYKRQEIYHGPYLDTAPDIIAVTKNVEYSYRVDVFGDNIFETPEDPTPANHRMDGVFMSIGPNIKKGENISRRHIMDIAPTILYLMREKIPEDMDGEIIKSAVDNDFLEKNTPSYGNGAKKDNIVGYGEANIDDEGRREIEENLRNLGYLA